MYEIWSDNFGEATWFRSLDNRLTGASVETIGSRGTNPKIIENLIAYDRPDIVLLDDGRPLLVLEKTREVPTGHNGGQRFARLARAAEFQIPTLYFLPFDAKKHGRYASICNINTRILAAMLRMGDIHECWVLPVNWPCDGDGELVIDGTENAVLEKLVGEILSMKSGEDSSCFRTHENWVRTELQRRNSVFPKYKAPPPSVEVKETKHFLHKQGLSDHEHAAQLLKRERSLVYRMDMSPTACRRQDPYTGTQFIYDYLWARTGPLPSQRSQNLVLHVPNVPLETWKAANPNNPNTKSCNWYLIADAIVLSDGLIPITDWPANDS